MLLKAFHGGKAIKIPVVWEFVSNIYDIFLKCNCANCTPHYVLDFAMDIIIKWTGIHTAKMVSVPEVMMGQD